MQRHIGNKGKKMSENIHEMALGISLAQLSAELTWGQSVQKYVPGCWIIDPDRVAHSTQRYSKVVHHIPFNYYYT